MLWWSGLALVLDGWFGGLVVLWVLGVMFVAVFGWLIWVRHRFCVTFGCGWSGLWGFRVIVVVVLWVLTVCAGV